MKNATKYPPGWDEERAMRVLRHYDSLSGDEKVAEDVAAIKDFTQTLMEISNDLAPAAQALPEDRAT